MKQKDTKKKENRILYAIAWRTSVIQEKLITLEMIQINKKHYVTNSQYNVKLVQLLNSSN